MFPACTGANGGGCPRIDCVAVARLVSQGSPGKMERSNLAEL